MESKEALNYIRTHGVWRFASIPGWNTPDEKLIKSFETIEKDLEVLEINKEYKTLLKYFITKHAIAVQLVPVDEALKICKGSMTGIMCQNKEQVYIIENQYGEKEVVSDRIGELIMKFYNEIKGIS